jgi:peptide-methionine (S)-S-oxide reductase
MKEERAIFARGCFWGMQDLIRRLDGVTSTRVGYTGGDVPNATYHNHGTHAEAIEIIFDPTKISYRRLLEFFSRSTTRPRKTVRGMMWDSAIARRFSITAQNKSESPKIRSPTLKLQDFGQAGS